MFKKQVTLHGLRAYLTRLSSFVTPRGFVAGGEASVGRKGGNVVLPGSPAVVASFEDFLSSDTGGQFNGWYRVNGDADTGASGTVSRQAMTNGVMRISFAGTPMACSGDASGVTGGPIRNWKANQGNLRYATRVKLPSLASVNAFFGFSDSGGSEMPAYDTGSNTLIPLGDAAEAIGFMYSNLGASTAWRGVATKGGTKQTVVHTSGPTANVYDVLEVQLSQDSGQTADFFINGVHIGRLSNPLDAAVGLSPGHWVFGSDTGTIQADIDWTNISADRDSGT
jgi:hypothetical protein